MDTQSQEMFDTILSKDKASLSNEEMGFLMARRGYLNDADRARYAEEIKLHEKGELLTSPDGEDDEEVDLADLSEAKLKAKAKEMKIEGFSKMKKPALIKAIEEAIAENEDEE